MKKIFVASVFLGLASMAQAAFIQCTPGQIDIVQNATGVTTSNFTCSPGVGGAAGTGDDNMAGDGATITSVRLAVSGTFSDNNAVIGTTYSVVATTNNGSGILNVTCTATGTGVATPLGANATANCTSTPGATTAVGGSPDVLAAFTVTVTGSNSAPNPLPFNASGSVYYEVAATTPPPAIPEPTTYAMMAAGLVSFYMVRRKS